MTSRPCLQTITIQIVSNISRSKSDQTEKITREIFLFKNYAENEVGRLVLDLVLFFLKDFI